MDDPSTIEAKYHVLDFEIIDATDEIIDKSRLLLLNVQKYLSGEDSVEQVFSKMGKAMKQIDSEIAGLEEYIKTKTRESGAAEASESLAKHRKRIQKLIDKKSTSVDTQFDLLKYLELKEAAKYQSEIEENATKWRDFMASIPRKFQKIEQLLE